MDNMEGKSLTRNRCFWIALFLPSGTINIVTTKKYYLEKFDRLRSYYIQL